MNRKLKLMLYLTTTLILCICVLGNMFIMNRNVLATTDIQSESNGIDVNMESSSNCVAQENEATTIKYSITPNEYKTSVEEAVFLVDVSSNMKDGATRGKMQFAQNVTVNVNDLVNNSQSQLGAKININAGIIGFADAGYSLVNQNSDKNLDNVVMHTSNNLDPVANNIMGTINNMNSYVRNINSALVKANSLLNGDNNTVIQNRNKAIIIISSGKINNIDANTVKKIKDNGYRIIMLDISNRSSTQIDTESESNLKQITGSLSNNGKYTFIEINPNDNSILSNDEKKQLAMSQNIYMKIIPKSYDYADSSVWKSALQSTIYGSCGSNVGEDAYSVENAKFTFDLGGNFKIADKAIIEYNGKQEEVPIKDIGNNKVEIDISKFIVYEKSEQGFSPTIEKVYVSFDVTAIGNGGTFAKDVSGKDISNLSYTEIIGGQQLTNKILIETPTITVGEKDKPQINIKLDNLKVNGVSTKNYYNICPNDDVEFTYKVTAEDLLIGDINKTAKKEIVLLLDTSGSMNFRFKDDTDAAKTGEKSRITTLKDSAKSFIDKFNNVSDVQIGIVPYSYYAGYANDIKSVTTISDNNKSDFKEYIDNIKVDGATNQGDGLRKAEQMLQNGDIDTQKYLIVITDGVATAITVGDPGLNAKNSIYEYVNDVYTFRNGNLNLQNGYRGDYIQNSSGNDYMKFYGYYNWQGEFVLNSNYGDTKNFPVTEINDFNYNQAIKYIDFIDYIGDTKIINRKGTDYAIRIGKKLKQEMPKLKVETIGCALKTDTVNLAKEVNNSMNGTYYSADNENSTKEIFDDLADSILSDYEIKNVNLNLNIPDNFEISPDETSFEKTNAGYIKSLENIKYKLNADKTKYVAEPFYITFKLKAKSVGSINFGTKCEVTYDSVKNNQMKNALPTTQLKIVDKTFPNINVDLQSPKEVTYLGNPIDIKYKINPQEFSYEDMYGKLLPKDVFLLIDSSAINKINTGNNIFNKIASDEILKLAKTRYSIITYGNNTTDGIRYVNESMGQRDIQNEGVYSKYIEDVLNSASNSSTQGSTYKIAPALRKVEEIDEDGRSDKDLTKNIDNGRENGEKVVIIVGEKSINDMNELSDEAKILSNKGYKIITLNLGDIVIKDKWKNQDGYTDSEEGEIEPNNNLKEMHYKLSNEVIRSNETLQDRIDNDYFIKINYDQFNNYKKNITQMNQFFNQQDNFSLNLLNNQVSPKIALDLRGSFDENLSIINPQFEFNLQGKCDIIGTPQYDTQSVSNFQHKQNDENIVTFNVPSISYKLNYDTGRYQLTAMSTQPIVTLTIKPKDTIKSTFKFSDGQAYFNYKDIIYGQDKKLLLETPSIMFNTKLPDLF